MKRILISCMLLITAQAKAETTSQVIQGYFSGPGWDFPVFMSQQTPYHGFYKTFNNLDDLRTVENINLPCEVHNFLTPKSSSELNSNHFEVILNRQRGACIKINLGAGKIYKINRSITIKRPNVIIQGNGNDANRPTIQASNDFYSPLADAGTLVRLVEYEEPFQYVPSNVKLDNIIFKQNGNAHWSIRVGDSPTTNKIPSNIIISNSVFEGPLGRMAVYKVNGLDVYKNEFVFEGNQGDRANLGFLFHPGDEGMYTPVKRHKNIAIHDNVFKGSNNEAIDFNSPAKNIIVYDNKITPGQSSPTVVREEFLDIGTGVGTVENMSISKNDFQCNFNTVNDIPENSAIFIKQGSKNIFVESNRFRGTCNSTNHSLYPKAIIRLLNVSDVAIIGNAADNVSEPSAHDVHEIVGNIDSVKWADSYYSNALRVWRNRGVK